MRLPNDLMYSIPGSLFRKDTDEVSKPGTAPNRADGVHPKHSTRTIESVPPIADLPSVVPAECIT